MYSGPLAPSCGCSDCFVVIYVSVNLLNTPQSDNDNNKNIINNNNNNNKNNAITFQFVTYELRKDRRSYIILFMAKKNFKTGTSIEIVGLESLLSCLKQETRCF